MHHGIVFVDPTQAEVLQRDAAPLAGKAKPITDGVHRNSTGPAAAAGSAESLSEEIKRTKPYVLLRVIVAHKMDQALIFVRTKLDADNLEKFLVDVEGGRKCAFALLYQRLRFNFVCCSSAGSGEGQRRRVLLRCVAFGTLAARTQSQLASVS